MTIPESGGGEVLEDAAQDVLAGVYARASDAANQYTIDALLFEMDSKGVGPADLAELHRKRMVDPDDKGMWLRNRIDDTVGSTDAPWYSFDFFYGIGVHPRYRLQYNRTTKEVLLSEHQVDDTTNGRSIVPVQVPNDLSLADAKLLVESLLITEENSSTWNV